MWASGSACSWSMATALGDRDVLAERAQRANLALLGRRSASRGRLPFECPARPRQSDRRDYAERLVARGSRRETENRCRRRDLVGRSRHRCALGQQNGRQRGGGASRCELIGCMIDRGRNIATLFRECRPRLLSATRRCARVGSAHSRALRSRRHGADNRGWLRCLSRARMREYSPAC